jgi:hypothetical protein
MKYSTYRGAKPTAKDFVNVLPHQNTVRTTNRGYLTNCLCPTHDDNNPSMGIMDGDKQVIIKCFSKGCDPRSILPYFYERLDYYKNRGSNDR